MQGPNVGDYALEDLLYLFNDFANTCIARMCHRCDPLLRNWLPHHAQAAVQVELQAKGGTVQTHGKDKD